MQIYVSRKIRDHCIQLRNALPRTKLVRVDKKKERKKETPRCAARVTRSATSRRGAQLIHRHATDIGSDKGRILEPSMVLSVAAYRLI